VPELAGLRIGSFSALAPTGTGTGGSGLEQLGLNVLYADDEKPNRLLMSRYLTKLGCGCTVVSDGHDVYPALRASGQLADEPAASASGNSGTAVAPAIARADSTTTGVATPSLPSYPAAQRHYDVILMDIVMVRSDGAEVTSELVHKHKLRIPIVAVTGNARDRAYLLSCGFAAIIGKNCPGTSLKYV
jgi:CheY-like chemotaxis protein